jgi:hypothetical protein
MNLPLFKDFAQIREMGRQFRKKGDQNAKEKMHALADFKSLIYIQKC